MEKMIFVICHEFYKVSRGHHIGEMRYKTVGQIWGEYYAILNHMSTATIEEMYLGLIMRG